MSLNANELSKAMVVNHQQNNPHNDTPSVRKFRSSSTKDTWTKPRVGGGIRGGRWGWLGLGENADNCT